MATTRVLGLDQLLCGNHFQLGRDAEPATEVLYTDAQLPDLNELADNVSAVS